MAVGGNYKSTGTKSLSMASGGSESSLSGPTTSSRSYPKSGATMPLPGNTTSAPFNPQKVAVTTIYVGGVGS